LERTSGDGDGDDVAHFVVLKGGADGRLDGEFAFGEIGLVGVDKRVNTLASRR